MLRSGTGKTPNQKTPTMTPPTVGFIGAGRVARIFLTGWQQQNALPAHLILSDCNPEALAKLKTAFPSVEAAADNLAAAAAQDLVFLAVHPPAMAAAAEAVKTHLKPKAMVISLAPKFTLARLSEMLGGFSHLARVIPNASSIIGAGFNPLAFAPALAAADKSSLIQLLSPLGECPEVPEVKLEAYALLSAMGPTYLWFQLQALREVAAGFGLTDAEIVPAMKRMVCGSTRTLLESGLTPAEVMDLVPVKPLAEMEANVSEMYRTKLPAIYQKIKP
jgi:pyrroline-5-carboxylate reductase